MTSPFKDRTQGDTDQRAVQEFHRYDDFNGSPDAHHHGLGKTRNEASEGSHIHDGITSIAILSGVTFTGSRTTNAADLINQICNALAAIGATNSTSA